LVIWPVKIVPKMTYNALNRTLSLYTSTTCPFLWQTPTQCWHSLLAWISGERLWEEQQG